MKIPPYTTTAVSCLIAVFFVNPLIADTQIKLTGRKDLVLGVESRQTVLEVAREHLSEKSGEFLVKIESVDSPYIFDEPVVPVARKDDPIAEPEVVVVHYDDASVLQVVAENFAQQVRGTLVRGTSSFLQLKGGSMVKAGTSFPVSIPQAQDKKFTVTITEITANSYTLELGEATRTVSLSGSAPLSGSLQLD